MSNFENIATSALEIVEVECDSSTSTSIEQMFKEDNDTSSEKRVGNREEDEHTPIIKDAIFVFSSVQTLASVS